MKQALPAPVAPADDLNWYMVGLDDEASTLLVSLSKVTGQGPEKTLSELVRAILVEDAEAHGERPVEVRPPVHH